MKYLTNVYNISQTSQDQKAVAATGQVWEEGVQQDPLISSPRVH